MILPLRGPTFAFANHRENRAASVGLTETGPDKRGWTQKERAHSPCGVCAL
jgi:hypothetical protein